jgi:hypothetical protein
LRMQTGQAMLALLHCSIDVVRSSWLARLMRLSGFSSLPL